MSRPSESLPPSCDLAGLAHTCLDHLDREEAALYGVHGATQRMHEALLQGNAAVLREAQQQQQGLLRELEQLRGQRGELLAEVTRELELDSGSTPLRQLIGRLPGPLAERLDAARVRTARIAEELDVLNRRNAAVASYCLQFMRHCLAEVTGGGCSGSRYGPSGEQLEAYRRPILEARG